MNGESSTRCLGWSIAGLRSGAHDECPSPFSGLLHCGCASPRPGPVRGLSGLQLVAEVTPAALSDLMLVEGSEVWVSFKATDVSIYPA